MVQVPHKGAVRVIDAGIGKFLLHTISGEAVPLDGGRTTLTFSEQGWGKLLHASGETLVKQMLNIKVSTCPGRGFFFCARGCDTSTWWKAMCTPFLKYPQLQSPEHKRVNLTYSNIEFHLHGQRLFWSMKTVQDRWRNSNILRPNTFFLTH